MTADTARRRLGLRPLIGEHWADKIITSEHRKRWLRKERWQCRKAMAAQGVTPPIEIWRAA